MIFLPRRALRIFIFAATAISIAACSRAPQKTAAADPHAPIILGDIGSYTTAPKYANNCRKGWELAVQEINARGGVLGRPLKVLSRDDRGQPGESVRCAQELVQRDGAQLLFSGFYDHCSLAISGWCKQNKVLFIKTLGGTDAFVWQQGHRYAFRTGLTNWLACAMLAEEAAKLPAKRWAIVAPNYEYGHAMATTFRNRLSALRPDVEWVAEQFPPLNKIDAGPVVQAIKRAQPEALLSVLFQSDLIDFVREGNKRELFKSLPVISTQAGRPEELDILKNETPVGWTTYGYPAAELPAPEHQRFVQAYRALHQEDPGLMSICGYLAVHFFAEAVTKAGTTETEKVVDALEQLTIASPLGPVTMRGLDHQTDRGIWIGKTAVRDGKGVLVDYQFKPIAPFLPSEEQIRQWRDER